MTSRLFVWRLEAVVDQIARANIFGSAKITQHLNFVSKVTREVVLGRF